MKWNDSINMYEENTKVMKQKLLDWWNSDIYMLEQCYKTYSEEKANAWNKCINLRLDYDGYYLNVISHNSWIFTAGFIFEKNSEWYFVYITPCKRVAMNITKYVYFAKEGYTNVYNIRLKINEVND